MQRRELLTLIGATTVAPLLAPRLEAQAPLQAGRALSAAQLALVTALADTILPRTDSPGAVDVGAPAYVDLMLAEWYSAPEREAILRGLDAWDARCREEQGAGFAALEPAGRTAFLTKVDADTGAAGTAAGAYATLKGVLVHGYVTARPVAEAHRSMPIIPGRFDGCVPVGDGR